MSKQVTVRISDVLIDREGNEVAVASQDVHGTPQSIHEEVAAVRGHYSTHANVDLWGAERKAA